VSITVSNSTNPNTPIELILSGGFEPTVSGWAKTGAAFFSTGGVQHTGVGYSYLAKANSVTGTLSQTIAIPTGTNPSLSFWLNVTSSEPSTTVASDTLSVEVLNSTGVLLQTLATYSNLNTGPPGAYALKGGFSLGAFAGQRVRLQFRAVTNAVNVTAFRIDDVSVTAAAPSPPPARELIVSGGFEPTVGGWTKTGAAFFSTGGVQHSGVGYGYLAKANSVTGALSQAISVPTGTRPSLSFWLNVTSDEPSTTVASDKMFVEVLNATGVVVSTLATYSNLDKGAVGAYVLKSALSLAPYAGQAVRLRFRAATDAVNATAFRIDDVSVK
jgi:DNA gyrase inhibitor GyrI